MYLYTNLVGGTQAFTKRKMKFYMNWRDESFRDESFRARV